MIWTSLQNEQFLLLSITTSVHLVYMYAKFMNIIEFFSANLTYRVVRMLICVYFHDITFTKQNKKVMRLDSLLIEPMRLIEEKSWGKMDLYFTIFLLYTSYYNTWLTRRLIYFVGCMMMMIIESIMLHDKVIYLLPTFTWSASYRLFSEPWN